MNQVVRGSLRLHKANGRVGATVDAGTVLPKVGCGGIHHVGIARGWERVEVEMRVGGWQIG